MEGLHYLSFYSFFECFLYSFIKLMTSLPRPPSGAIFYATPGYMLPVYAVALEDPISKIIFGSLLELVTQFLNIYKYYRKR